MGVLPAPLLLVLFLQQAPATCVDLSSCRAAALEAQSRKDFEAFHDLAWLTYRKGRADDPELMLMLARAQSLSGRPSDALVMLQRIIARGIATDAETSEDFARVRALPRWKELFGQADAAAPSPAATAVTPPAAAEAPRSAPPPSAPPPSATKPAAPSPSVPSAPASDVAPSPKGSGSATAPSGVSPAKPGRTGRASGAPLSFTTLLKPTALAYDAVSKRYVIADRDARRIAIIDENTGQVSTLAGTQAALGEIGGIAIDPQQGDLWVVSTSDGGSRLHKLQLISGRVVSTIPVTGGKAPIVAMTFVRGDGLVAADASGALLRLSARGKLDQFADLEYVPRTIASDAAGRLYVSPGGPRLARFAIDPRPGAREVFTLPDDKVLDGGVAIVGDRLHLLVQGESGFEIRTVPLRR